ncbi:MAG: endonuclease/exonuclease/phosphatase family protein, partial [Candidatus Poribacteria bacterium]|nr:endonuclease/exonuclease/phosphatase family protein [Candidatus Poribacteria bacterium]
TQEGFYHQVRHIAADNPQYDWIGTGRDGGSRSEFMAIYYKRDRFEPLEYDHFWLSDTPNIVGSITWQRGNRRMLTWARFREMETGREFVFANTHFDHAAEEAQYRAARLVNERIGGMTDAPLFLVGDFNAGQDSRAYDVLTRHGGFRDTWEEANRRGDAISSFHNWKGIREGVRIDWLLFKGDVETDSTRVVTYAVDGRYPSDHFPVTATVTLNG